jgi:hypothetical protein
MSCDKNYMSLTVQSSGNDGTAVAACAQDGYDFYATCNGDDGNGGSGTWGSISQFATNAYYSICADMNAGPTVYTWYGNPYSTYFPCTAGKGFNSTDGTNGYCSACDTANGYGSDYGFGFCVD